MPPGAHEFTDLTVPGRRAPVDNGVLLGHPSTNGSILPLSPQRLPPESPTVAKMNSLAIDIPAAEVRRFSRIPSWCWWLLALCPLALKLLLSLHHLKLSWDDAAITAACSRTWAETGRIALTPASQVVESFSSVSWFLLLSIPYFFTHNPDAGLIWMKLLSACFLLLSLRLIYVIARRQLDNHPAAIVSVLLFAYCYASDREMEDGMEMTLATFLLLLLFQILTRDKERWRVLYASILSVLLLLTRFEMPFMLGLLFCGFFYATWRNLPLAIPLRDLFKVITAAAFSFLLIALWRHHVFGEWMPNTVYAKRLFPYSDWSTPAKFIATRVEAIKEPILVLAVPLLFAAYLFFRDMGGTKPFLRPTASRFHPAIWMLAMGCFLFGAMFGHNWGHTGRMISPMLPFLILAIIGVCLNAVPDKRLLTQMFAVLLIGHGLIWLQQEAVYPVRYGSMESIGPLGLGAESIRTALHLNRMVVMLPDVGASSLCCERLDIVDSGLLANATLARSGWSGFEPYFRRVRPDLVETDSIWATTTNIYINGLLDNYSIVAAHGARFFIRNDLYAKLLNEHVGRLLPVGMAPACMALNSWDSREDAQFSLSKRTCIVLDGQLGS